MSILPKIYTLKDEAQAQLYEWFDKEIHSLPKRADGTIDPFGGGLVDNKVPKKNLITLGWHARL